VRVLDSTPVYYAVATQGTVAQLRALDRYYPLLAARVRTALCRDDDYATPGNRRVIGMILPPGRRWWTRWSGIAPLPLPPATAK